MTLSERDDRKGFLSIVINIYSYSLHKIKDLYATYLFYSNKVVVSTLS